MRELLSIDDPTISIGARLFVVLPIVAVMFGIWCLKLDIYGGALIFTLSIAFWVWWVRVGVNRRYT